MYNCSSETLMNIAFTKIIKFIKNKNIFCANTCKAMQEKNYDVHLFAGDCMSENNFFKNYFIKNLKMSF